MCKAWDDHKKRGIQEGRYLEIYSLVQGWHNRAGIRSKATEYDVCRL